jgi:hypothetical protein
MKHAVRVINITLHNGAGRQSNYAFSPRRVKLGAKL